MINGRKLAARGEKRIPRLPFGQGRNDKLKWGVSMRVNKLQKESVDSPKTTTGAEARIIAYV